MTVATMNLEMDDGIRLGATWFGCPLNSVGARYSLLSISCPLICLVSHDLTDGTSKILTLSKYHVMIPVLLQTSTLMSAILCPSLIMAYPQRENTNHDNYSQLIVC